MTEFAKIIEYIAPSNIALLIVIFLLFRAMEKKDTLIERLGERITKNSVVTKEMSTLIGVLVNGRRE